MDPAASFKTETCRRLFDAWIVTRGPSLLPRRSAIDIRAFRGILPNIAMLEVRNPDLVLVRLAGTAYRDIFGFEPTWENLLDITPASIRRLRSYRYHMGVSQPCGAVAELSFAYSTEATDAFEFLSLPLAPDLPGQAPLVICAIESLLGRRWKRRESAQVVGGPADNFRFLDIGAGVPQSAEPPAESWWAKPARDRLERGASLQTA